MRNLKFAGRSTLPLPNNTDHAPKTCWDASTDSLICCSGPSADSTLVELYRISDHVTKSDELSSIASWDAPCPHPDLACDEVLNLQYLADTQSACIVFAGGDIVVIRESPLAGEELLEIVGSVDAGIAAARWSPDEELLVLVTKAKACIFMSRDFEPVTESSFSAEDAKLSKHVNVGWGKKETQFQGKRAKALRDPTMPEYVDEGLRSTRDRGQISISWRGDGQYVAINSLEEGSRRMIRVFSRDGVLDSVSEPTDYLEGSLSWRPAGNLLAAVKRTDATSEVVFFERNGLRHGSFPLQLSPADATADISLEWNSDSTVLAVLLPDRVQLWTMGNYHYYLKQEIFHSGMAQSLPELRWHPELPLRLAVSTEGSVKFNDMALAVTRGPTTSPHDRGLIFVIDGSNIKITPLRTANVPPPMSLHEIDLGSNVIDIATGSDGTHFAVLQSQHVSLWHYDPAKRTSAPKQILKREHGIEPDKVLQIELDSNDGLLIVTEYQSKAKTNLHKLHLVESTAESAFSLSSSIDGPVSIHQWCKGLAIAAQSRQGTVIALNDDNRRITKFPNYCPWVELVDIGEETLTFGLSPNGTLYANDKVLAPNCTSFATTPTHLIFTTTSHLLKFVHLSSVADLEVPLDQPEVDERCRAIERGGRIVTVMPSAYAVVLQMPRGNLETVYPRALVLAGIRKAIEEKDYKTAFMACRNQRVDMNILHDHAPEQFMVNVPLFIDQVKRIDYIDLFLSQLREEDVSQTMYKNTARSSATNGIALPTHREPTQPTLPSLDLPSTKVNRICDAFLSTLKNKTSTNLQNIITANVCKNPPDLQGGLAVISQLRKAGDDLAERAAEHICFLADVNRLYDTALSMYDLDLTLQIAQQSQKDPREYLPYFHKLQELTPLRRQFTIDHDLEKHAKAIRHLHEMDVFDELRTYAEKYELYSVALELCKYQPERLGELMDIYANFLLDKNKTKEAGMAYEFLANFTAALLAYKSSATEWREALFCASVIPLSTHEQAALAKDLADALVESRDYKAAATIHLEHLKDIESAVRLYCKASLHSDALRLAVLHTTSPAERNALLSETLDPALNESFTSTTELLADMKSQLSAQIPRLRELRVKKAQDPLVFYGGDPSSLAGVGENGVMQDFPDNISLAPTDASTSAGTFMTRYTGRGTMNTLSTNATRKTSKNKRREERKRARGKKGSVYEEEYLINSIKRLIERANSVAEDIRGLIEVLMRRGMRVQSVAVEDAMVDVMGACQSCLGEVFGGAAVGSENKDGGQGGDGHNDGEVDLERMRGADAVFLEAMEGVDKIVAPVVKKFERLGLLG